MNAPYVFACILIVESLIGWTLRGSIQEYIDVYLSRETFIEVRKSFPYLVAKEFATGGGDVRLTFFALLSLLLTKNTGPLFQISFL